MDYSEVITLTLTRNECIQILNLMIDLAGMGYDSRLIRDLHHKIFDQTFPDERR